MNLVVFLSSIFFWFVLLVLAILNAGFRTKILQERLGELRAHQVASLTFITLIMIISVVFAALMISLATMIDLWTIGILWVILTVMFEFLFGHYVMKHPWKRLLNDYNLLKGRLWSLVIITILIGPSCGGLLVGY